MRDLSQASAPISLCTLEINAKPNVSHCLIKIRSLFALHCIEKIADHCVEDKQGKRNINPVGRILTRNRILQGLGYLQDEDSVIQDE